MPRRKLTEEERAVSSQRKIELQRIRRQNTRISKVRNLLIDSDRTVAQQNKILINPQIVTNTDFDESLIIEHTCGEMNLICSSCNAKHFLGELPKDKIFTQ